MQDKKGCILLGYSGHAYVVAEAVLLSGLELIGYAEKVEAVSNPFNLQYYGAETDKNFPGWKATRQYVLGIGNNSIRSKVAQIVKQNGGECLTVIHPVASVSKLAVVGAGTFVARNVSVNPLCEIGENVILNTSCSVDHDCKIHDGAHIAPGAVLAGNVTVGKGAFVGANSVVKEGVKIADGAVVGAGSVILKDVPPGAFVAGNPGKTIK